MTIASATKKLLTLRPKPSTQVQSDRELIAREAKKAELEDWRADVRDRLMEDCPGERPLRPAEREALKAQLRESYRAEGFRDDLIFDGGVYRHKSE